MVRWSAIPIATIASCFCASLNAQGPARIPLSSDTLGLYFSSRGFRFDSVYQKAVLSTALEPLTGKAAFLLGLADSLAARISQAGFTPLNLHRYPSYAPYIEGADSLPPGWKGIFYIQGLELRAIPQKAVYAQSNRFRSEKYHRLEFTLTMLYRQRHTVKTLTHSQELPVEGWRQALIEALQQEILRLTAQD